MSPWPSFPNKPLPQVNNAPSSETAAVWYGPQDTCVVWRESVDMVDEEEVFTVELAQRVRHR